VNVDVTVVKSDPALTVWISTNKGGLAFNSLLGSARTNNDFARYQPPLPYHYTIQQFEGSLHLHSKPRCLNVTYQYTLIVETLKDNETVNGYIGALKQLAPSNNFGEFPRRALFRKLIADI